MPRHFITGSTTTSVTITYKHTTEPATKASVKESLDEENRRLRKEVRLLKQERDILKKATAYFAKETL
jgi:transposase